MTETTAAPPNARPMPPSARRRALFAWLGVFPMITLVQWVAGPHLADLPLVVRTFIVTAIAVPTSVILLVPNITKMVNRSFPPR